MQHTLGYEFPLGHEVEIVSYSTLHVSYSLLCTFHEDAENDLLALHLSPKPVVMFYKWHNTLNKLEHSNINHNTQYYLVVMIDHTELLVDWHCTAFQHVQQDGTQTACSTSWNRNAFQHVQQAGTNSIFNMFNKLEHKRMWNTNTVEHICFIGV